LAKLAEVVPYKGGEIKHEAILDHILTLISGAAEQKRHRMTVGFSPSEHYRHIGDRQERHMIQIRDAPETELTKLAKRLRTILNNDCIEVRLENPVSLLIVLCDAKTPDRVAESSPTDRTETPIQTISPEPNAPSKPATKTPTNPATNHATKTPTNPAMNPATNPATKSQPVSVPVKSLPYGSDMFEERMIEPLGGSTGLTKYRLPIHTNSEIENLKWVFDHLCNPSIL
jgi:hypothetical protein